jgi:hypothetical protein
MKDTTLSKKRMNDTVIIFYMSYNGSEKGRIP